MFLIIQKTFLFFSSVAKELVSVKLNIIVKPRFVFKVLKNCINCLTLLNYGEGCGCYLQSLHPLPCHNTKPGTPKCIVFGATVLNGADVKKQAFLDITDLVKRLPGNLSLSSKLRQ